MENGLYGSICLSDIPKELITTHPNGKKYLKIVIRRRRQADRFGNTYYVKARADKGHDAEGVNLFIGAMRENQPFVEQTSALKENPELKAKVQGFIDGLGDDNLPF